MSSHSTTELRFNTNFQNQMRSKIRPTSMKHVSYTIVHVRYRASTLRANSSIARSLFRARKVFMYYSLTSALAASRRVLCTPDLIPQHSTTACTDKMSANKKINDGTEALLKNKTFFLCRKN